MNSCLPICNVIDEPLKTNFEGSLNIFCDKAPGSSAAARVLFTRRPVSCVTFMFGENTNVMPSNVLPAPSCLSFLLICIEPLRSLLPLEMNLYLIY